MKHTRPAGFYLSVEDLNHLDRIMGLLSDFVSIVLEQTIEELDRSIEAANKESISEGENNTY